MKRFSKIIAVLVALLLIASVIPAAFAAGTTVEPGKKASVSFTFKKIYGIDGEFSFSNSKMISGDVTYKAKTNMMGSVQNNVAFFYGSAEDTITITATFKVSASAKDGDKCDVTFKYETSDIDGNMSEWKTAKKTVTVKVPTEPEQTEPEETTKPSKPSKPSTTPKPTTPTVTVDFTALNKQMDKAKELKKDGYSAESWEALQAAIKAAEEARKSGDQAAIDAAEKALAEAIKNLKTLDYKPLEDAIAKTESFLTGETLEGKLGALLDALTGAKKLVGKAEDQASIDAAAKALTDALAALEKALAELGKDQIVEVEVEPSGDYCNISIHYVWPVLFFISLAVNLAFVVLAVLYVRRKKKETDNTPLVDYDISDDAE